MNFKLTNLSTINEKYGKSMELLKDTTWEICAIVADVPVIAVLTGCAVNLKQVH